MLITKRDEQDGLFSVFTTEEITWQLDLKNDSAIDMSIPFKLCRDSRVLNINNVVVVQPAVIVLPQLNNGIKKSRYQKILDAVKLFGFSDAACKILVHKSKFGDDVTCNETVGGYYYMSVFLSDKELSELDVNYPRNFILPPFVIGGHRRVLVRAGSTIAERNRLMKSIEYKQLVDGSLTRPKDWLSIISLSSRSNTVSKPKPNVQYSDWRDNLSNVSDSEDHIDIVEDVNINPKKREREPEPNVHEPEPAQEDYYYLYHLDKNRIVEMDNEHEHEENVPEQIVGCETDFDMVEDVMHTLFPEAMVDESSK
jgi:hypothetical protein